jgi:hypothetical protein
MSLWRIASDVPGRMAAWPGWDVALIWAWPIRRDAEARNVCVGVAAGKGELESIAHESRQAIETLGRSAVMAVLDEVDPPRRVHRSTTGLLRDPNRDARSLRRSEEACLLVRRTDRLGL